MQGWTIKRFEPTHAYVLLPSSTESLASMRIPLVAKGSLDHVWRDLQGEKANSANWKQDSGLKS